MEDLNEKRLQRIKEIYPLITTTKDYTDIIRDPEIDIIAIATGRDPFQVRVGST